MKQEKRTPGTEQSTGGKGEHDNHHPDIIPPNIADLSQPGEPERLLDEAVAFLMDWCRDGPWVLTSIVPDGGTTTETFHATDASIAQMRQWIGARLGKQNIYFTVNRTYGDVESKPNKGAIAAIRAVHVDVDPRPGENVGAERARAVRKLREYDPPPTIIIDSGGGMQGFWLLDDEADVGGSADLARLFWRRADEAKRGKLTPDERAAVEAHEARLRDAVELRNLRPEVTLQADACHNADRIMRLVGTVNVPNKKKRGRGRVPTVASVVEADWSRRYPLDAFPPADVKPTTSASDAPVSISSDRANVDLEALPISTRCRAIIVNGGDPDDPGRNESRSEWLWGVVCEMVRAGVADDDIATVILDRDYAISAHVYDQPRPEQYAQRQIQRARDEAIHPKLRELNDLHAVLSNQDGKCRVMEFVEMPTGVKGKARLVPSLQSFEDVRNRYLNQRVAVGQDKDGKDIYMALGKWWLENPLRRQFHSLTFQPRAGEVVGDGARRRLNLWQGFAVRPEPGDWTLMRSHIRDVLARGDDRLAAYIERWMAWTVQNPDEPAEVALVFRGEPGTGKGVFGRAMAQLFGQHGLHTGGSELITGRFNLHFRDCCLLFADEVIWDGDRKAEAKIKTFLTEPTLTIEGKGKDAVSWPNMLHVVISSNSEWIVPAGPYERRYAVFDVSDEQRQQQAYFKPLYAEIGGGGLAAMLHDLLAMDLGDWHPRDDRPDTAALEDQRARGLDPVNAAVLDMLREGALTFDAGDDPRGTVARPFVATNEFRDAIQQQTRGAVSANAVSKALERIGAVKSRNGRPSGWVLPTLEQARAGWNRCPDLPTQEWDDEEDWTGGEPF